MRRGKANQGVVLYITRVSQSEEEEEGSVGLFSLIDETRFPNLISYYAK